MYYTQAVNATTHKFIVQFPVLNTLIHFPVSQNVNAASSELMEKKEIIVRVIINLESEKLSHVQERVFLKGFPAWLQCDLSYPFG